MKRFSFKMLAVAVAVCAVCWLGCGGGDNGNPADNSGNNNSNNSNNNGNNNGGDTNHDGKLINAANEAWLHGSSCASADLGHIYKSNGVAMQVRPNDGVWSVSAEVTWRTDGNKLTITNHGRELSGTYEISNSTLIVTDDDGPTTFKKCGGLTIVG